MKDAPAPLQLKWLLFSLLAVASVWFAWRGPARIQSEGGDLAMFYAGTRAWSAGQNPYDYEVIRTAFVKAGGPEPTNERKFVSLYPPTLYACLSPLSLLSWQNARLVWGGINVLLVPVLIIGLIRLSNTDSGRFGLILLTAIVLAWAPLQTAISLGQVAIVVVTSLIFSLLAMRKGQYLIAGVLLGIATTIKPQLAGIFLLFALWLGNYHVFGIAAATIAVITAIAVVPLELWSPSWMTDLVNNVQSFVEGGPGDPASVNPTAHNNINIHSLLHMFFADRTHVSVISWLLVICVAMLLAISRSGRKTVAAEPLLLPSILAVATLFFVYHKFYDATLLLLVVCWLANSWSTQTKDYSKWIVVIGLVVFLIPGAAALTIASQRGFIPNTVQDSWWYQTLVLRHQIWALLCILIALLARFYKQADCPSAEVDVPESAAGRN